MRIHYASDLHLEYAVNRDFVKERLHALEGDVLLLAGDIQELANHSLSNDVWDWCAEHFRQTLIVPGNHEYGKGIVPDAGEYRFPVRENVAYHHNRTVRIDDVDFICCTLWPVPEPEAGEFAELVMPYFHGPDAPSIRERHAESVDFIFQAIERSDARKTVVVTHFVPIPDLVPLGKAGPDKLSVFACDLADRIRTIGPDVWLFGHTHDTVDTVVGNTRLISHSLGSLEHRTPEGFELGQFIEL